MSVGRQGERPDPRERADGVMEELQTLVSGWVREARSKIALWQQRRRIQEELERLDDQALAELGLMRCQAALLARAFPGASQQLGQILTRLGLSTKDGSLDRLTYHDLYRTCATCAKRHRCRNWLASAKGSEGYPSFCPNGWMFRRLLETRHA